MTVGLVSPNVLWFLHKDKALTPFLKKCAIAHEAIIVNPHHMGVNISYELGFADWLISMLSNDPGDAIVLARLIGERGCFRRPRQYGIAENSIAHSDSNIRRVLSLYPTLLNGKDEFLRNYEIGEVNLLETVADLGRVMLLKESIADSSGLYDVRHHFLMSRSGSSDPNEVSMQSVEECEFEIPDFGSMSWEQIEILRRDSHIRYFREFLNEKKSPAATSDSFWKLVEEQKPNAMTTALWGCFRMPP